MPQLYGNKTKFNGHLLNYELVSVGDNSSDRMFGLKTSTEYEDSVGDIPLFLKRKKERQTIPIQLFKCDYLGNGLPISDDELFELSRLLFAKDDIGILECNGLILYGHFTGESTSWRNGGRQGHITLNFELSSPYVYSPIMLNSVRVQDNKMIELTNKSNGSEEIKCDVEFELIKGNKIEIVNMTNGKRFIIDNLESNEKGIIYGDSREIVSYIDSKRNLFKLSNREFNSLCLKYGKNRFKVIAEDCKVKFIYQCQLTML